MKVRRLAHLALGAAVVLPLVGADPAVAVLLLDAELLALLGSVGLAMTRDDLRVAWFRVTASHAGVQFAAGVRLARVEPRTLLA